MAPCSNERLCQPRLSFVETLIDNGHDLLEHSVDIVERFILTRIAIVQIVLHFGRRHHRIVMRRHQISAERRLLFIHSGRVIKIDLMMGMPSSSTLYPFD